MISKTIFDNLDRAGEALKATGEPGMAIMLTGSDGKFSVGFKANPNGYGADMWEHDEKPSAAFARLLAKRADKAEELAFRERCRIRAEELVRAEIAAEQSQTRRAA